MKKGEFSLIYLKLDDYKLLRNIENEENSNEKKHNINNQTDQGNLLI